jgi:hypothetical protein
MAGLPRSAVGKALDNRSIAMSAAGFPLQSEVPE